MYCFRVVDEMTNSRTFSRLGKMIGIIIFLLIQPAQQFLSAQTQTVPAETLFVDLGSAVRRAIHLSPEVMAVASKRDFATARWDFARSSRFLPEFKVNTAHSLAPGLKGVGDTPTDLLYLDPDVRNDWDQLSMFNRVEAEAIQPVYTWGQLSGSIQAAMQGVSVESEGLRAKEADIALRTGELYTSVLLAEELFRLTGRIGEVLNQAKREIQRLLDDGAEDVDDADLFQVQLSELEFQRRVVEVTEQRKTANMALRRQLLVHDDIVIVAKEATLAPLPLTLDSLSIYFDHAMENRPELAQARAGLLARQALVKVAESDLYPKLFLGLTANLSGAAGRYRQPTPYLGDPFVSRSLQAGFGIRQNLNFMQTRAKVEQAQAERNEAKYLGEAAELLVLFEVEEAYRNFKIQQAALEAQDESLRLSSTWLLTEMNNFEFDLGDTENLVRAVQANLQLEAAYFEAVKRHNVAVLKLLDACGILVKQSQGGTLVE